MISSPKMTIALSRYHYLDLIRAIAIIMVVFSHSIQMLPKAYPFIKQFAEFGQYGVDVFFVLSGFLIGRLFWNEANTTGKVDTFRFYMRRAWRTMPPYFVALFFSYLAVKIQKDEVFHWQYLFFLQNYFQEIPFFLVSWSLCIEEHFYLFLAIFLPMISHSLKSRGILITIFSLALLPLVFRNVFGTGEDIHTFGYWATATHFRFEGLLMGVGIAYIAERYKQIQLPVFLTRLIYLGVVLFMLLSYRYHPRYMYHFGFTLMAAIIALTLLLLYYEKNFLAKEVKIIKYIALASYSIYLTHALAIHIALECSQLLNLETPLLIWLLMLLIIAMSGGLFYRLIEKPSIQLRNKLFS